MATLEATVAAGSERERALALGAALVTVAVWGSAFVGIRSASQELSPGALAFGRLAIASLALGVIVLLRREPLPSRRDLPAIAFVGAAWFGLYNITLNEAERRVDAGTAAMLVNIAPVFLAVLAGFVLHEGFPRPLVAGCAIAFAGAIVIGLATSERGVDAGWGAAMCVAAAAAYAGGVVAQKPLLARASGLQVTFLACTVGAVACLPFAPALVGEAADASAGTLAWTAYLGIVPTAIGFTTWAFGLKRTNAGKLGATTYLVPPIAVFLGWVFLGETPPALAYAGGVLCLAGVALTRARVLRPRLRV